MNIILGWFKFDKSLIGNYIPWMLDNSIQFVALKLIKFS
jgi:hypothetical protein